ncbi:hypothetical protein MEPL8_8c01090 [Melissococcus plutonius]|uniref:YaiI/YqxD family protein n=1 Tax=Melissococcus plutonius TaxID=33970 RepID=UPI00065DDFBA|nr:YaiI/YqxD family protein [Melissococcus plutonius]KMT33119.1 hypothetical protein MEPL6_1c01430 [Melissococcus plutonius]KMT33434.1 hypothetical protein MEPL8_8c01090 [Melissococcus plutonius]
MKVFIDGDGSTIKKAVIDWAIKKQLFVVIVTSIAHYSTKEFPNFISFVYVDKGVDSADYRILQLIKTGDILITQDYGLAALALAKRVIVLHHLGYEYTDEKITGLLNQRFLSAKMRKNEKYGKGPKPYTHKDLERFMHLLEEVVKKTAEDTQ